ncbi:nuclear transport factor 2 family protein [Streptomyces sp. NPDC049040]|uniref:nuclear transport factor 2 family protein n=1 Tax=Streptomyces sp. NPDC049040 TaxID=3365593 RepID=UPI00371BCD01
MTTLEDLAARLDRVEAELALHRLAHDYCVGADHHDRLRWEAVWALDAIWEISPNRVFRGLEAICAAVEQQWRTFPFMQHATANHTVAISGDMATGRSDVVVLAQLPDRRWLIGGGSYEDEYRRGEGVWRMTRRRARRPFDVIMGGEGAAPAGGPVRAHFDRWP